MRMRRQQEVIKKEISGATIRSTSKRRSAMKVLMFLDRENMPHTITEIAEELDMDWSTVKHNLLKLMECEFVEIVEDKMDSRTRYFQVVNKKATERAIELYKRRVSYKLGRLIPYKKIYSKKLKSDKRFIEECKFYGLTLGEGFNAVTTCPKIRSQTATDYSGRDQGLFLCRKES
ncbi:ArsR family transcriptional regulator [Thermoproteota archaeon]